MALLVMPNMLLHQTIFMHDAIDEETFFLDVFS